MNSLWLSNQKIFENKYENKGDIETDVCIIGAGIFGITCAYYLSKQGLKVTVLEKDFVGSKTTGHTTGKITSQHGLFYKYLVDAYDEKFAKDYLDANEEAIKNIKDIIDTENIKCDFKIQNNYVYATTEKEYNALKLEQSALDRIGFNCEFVTKAGLPFDIKGAICFKNQAQFNSIKYLDGLCKAILSKGGSIFTGTTAFDVQKINDTYTTFCSDFTVKSKYVIVATHYPFINFPGFYFTKLYQSSSYLIAIDPKKTLFNGMYISAAEPAFSFRTANYEGKELLLIGGGEHRTGEPPSYEYTYGALEDVAKKYYPDCEVLFRWDTRDCISLDKIPYVGHYSSLMPHVFVGTGFKKWGMTLSNVAANIVADEILQKENKYAYLFNPSRLSAFKNRDEFKNILVQSANSLVFDKFRPAQMNFDEIANNSGSIIEINNQKVGIYKDPNGKIFAVKPICTHLGCQLSWNDVDKTWDCPCHGSRFDFSGKNLYDPAIKDLESYNLD